MQPPVCLREAFSLLGHSSSGGDWSSSADEKSRKEVGVEQLLEQLIAAQKESTRIVSKDLNQIIQHQQRIMLCMAAGLGVTWALLENIHSEQLNRSSFKTLSSTSV